MRIFYTSNLKKQHICTKCAIQIYIYCVTNIAYEIAIINDKIYLKL